MNIVSKDRKIDETSNAPKCLYDKHRGAWNQIIVKNHVHELSKSSTFKQHKVRLLGWKTRCN